MRGFMCRASLAVLIIASVGPSQAQSSEAAGLGAAAEAATAAPSDGDAGQLIYYEVGRKNNITLRCPLKGDSYVWSINGTEYSRLPGEKERVRLDEGGAVLSVLGRTQEDDFGTYACASAGNTHAWDVRGRPLAKLPPNYNVIEGQKIKLVCRVFGKPYERVTWQYSNGTGNGSTAQEAFGERVSFLPNEQNVTDGVLQMEAARREDAGRYTCLVGEHAAETTVRVKDMYAALWPFLGICAEVFVLCAIILVYEKRRTKPELDDSDTDNHDQKKS